MPRALKQSATANGIAPPAAIRPTGDVTSNALSVMVASSMPVAVVGRKTERAVLGIADKDEIADLAMAAKRGRSCENHVMPDLAIVPDMAAIHEIAAVTDPRDAAARDRAGIHGHGFADGAARTDLKLREFAAIAQRLRWRTQRHEGIDRAALADRGLRRDVDVTDELAVGADDDVAADG